MEIDIEIESVVAERDKRISQLDYSKRNAFGVDAWFAPFATFAPLAPYTASSSLYSAAHIYSVTFLFM